ncbi:aromatic ring-hydroxylating dioxygenase subunit alpha [Phenylobacterium sp. LjRoot225]|uniref:aromatic ring-hydroxylating oxygenase subunit alpha n=1 Tax=Phenylobacterium sp. LjRoot225 TaxID=3342285 RepID=UPI003ED15BDE
MAEGDARFGAASFQVVDPERIPAKRYYDEDFYRLECERLWPHVWQMACRLEQIPNVGDWIEYSNLGKSVIVVRTQSGVKAFHNACRHRGVQLARGHGNCEVQGFTCPFHGWRWNIEGKNTFVYGRRLFGEGQLDPAELALAPCRSEVQLGCVFINFDDEAPAFREIIGPLADRLDAHNVGQLRAEWWYATVLPANWKTAMEAFMEGFHVMRTHPQLQEILPSLYNGMYAGDAGGAKLSVRENIGAQIEHMVELNRGMAGQIHAKEIEIARQLVDVDLPEDPNQALMTWFSLVQAQITQQLRAKGEPVPDLNAVAVSDPLKAVEFIFPHYFLLSFFSSMASYRIRPLGPESCLFELWSLTFFPEGEEPEPPMAPLMLPYDSDQFPPIPRQDYSNIPEQQIGLHAEGFEFMRLAKDIEGLISNYQRVIDGYLQAAAPERLAKATQALGGNFDGPIVDLGL